MVVYQYTRHVFGAKDSPTCANFALRRTASDNRVDFPEAASIIEKNLYMDDYLNSFPSPEIALSRSAEVVEVLRKGGFKLTKFVGNFPEIAKLQSPDVNTCTSSHVLGLEWSHADDTLVVSRGTKQPAIATVTQRTVLSCVAAVFDPIGLVAPFTINARLLLKSIWRLQGQQWDEPLPEKVCKDFQDWAKGLPQLASLKLSRPYFTASPDTVELHVFGDSSEEAFGAVAFLRAQLPRDGVLETQVAFVFGKGRVAPMKIITIPKLELQAALLAARIKKHVEDSLEYEVGNVFMWSDNSTVIQWLHSTEKQPVFVANRVNEILELTTVDQWNHVASANNPADAVTRGLSIEELRSSQWLEGPSFLRSCDWPFKPPSSAKFIVGKGKNTLCTASSDQAVPLPSANFTVAVKPIVPVMEWSRYSSYATLVRIIAYMFRVRNPHQRSCTWIEPDEFEIAEVKLFHLIQQESFPSEVKNLRADTPISKSSRVAQYTPFLGTDGVLRSTGRIKRLVGVDFNAKHPIILDGQHPVTKLLLRYLHEKHHHQGVEYMRALVQQRFAVVKLRAVLRTMSSRCVKCRKYRAQPLTPLMADLPKERLGYHKRPFENTGVDYFGPLYVSQRRATVKRWGFLFTCMTTRAVHIEIVPSLDTDSCVMGIERFAARRGRPSVLCSDNGTNFVGAEKELIQHMPELKGDALAERLARRGIVWKFNPPAAPHHGGSWERLVQSCKRLFYRILGTRRLTEEVLSTTMCLVEQFLNCRPLVPASNDPTDFEALTPNHFLLGAPSSCFPFELAGRDENCTFRKRYLQARAYASLIWERWLGEYAPTLNVRRKWNSPSRDLRKDDLVWVLDPSAPRGSYPLARIDQLVYGSDGIARSAHLKTSSGKLVRPTTKLIQVFDAPASRGEDVAYSE